MDWYDVTDEESSIQKNIHEARKIFKKHGDREYTDDELEKIVRFMRPLARMAVKQAMNENEWDHKLEKFPKGYHFKPKGYCCRICGHGASGENSWYDQYGLKCAICQKAVDWCVIPPTLATEKESYYSETQLSIYFNLKGKVLREWIKNGLIKGRTIKNEKGGKHHLVFLMTENEGFLPPLEMMRIGGWETEMIDGKEWQVSHPWYHYVDPFEYLKDYGIINYLKPIAAKAEEEPVMGPAVPEVALCYPCSYNVAGKQPAKRKAKRKK